MYEWSKRRYGSSQCPRPDAPVRPGTTVPPKVNKGFLSRCRLLRRSQTSTPPGPPMTQRDYSPAGNAPSTAAPSNKTLDRDASVGRGGDAMATEPAQDGRSPLSTHAASQAHDSSDGCAAADDLWPVSGGRRPAGCREAEEDRGCKGEDEEEGEERLAPVPMRRSSRLRASIRSRFPFRRHSWEAGKVDRYELDNDHERSFSLEDLDNDEITVMQAMGVTARQGRDPRRTPIAHWSGEVDSMLALEEEETEQDMGGAMGSEPQELFGALASGVGVGLNNTGSTARIEETSAEGVRIRLAEGDSTLRDPTACGTQGSREGSDLELTGGTKVHRTVSFFRKMAGITKNKEKDKMKEREKEAKERETRITNGHLFNSITVSGNTLCYACNKSIIAKEAFICPNCSVTIHKSCKDTLPSCTKVKQKQLKAAQAKNNSALHHVSMRHKVPMGRERPNSAIYPSDSFRPSPLFSQLGSRRGRTPFQSLSKSVSTNNIGNLNDDTPLGIRRILSQSTDSLNMRNRTLSVESLIDEGAEVIYNQLMGDLETDEKDFEADSWSLAVDSSFLQHHRKDVMKRQDVIYELIQTEIHHMRTLKIMSDIFRKGMLEDLAMERSAVDTMFPVLDDLIDVHVQFLSQLLERRKESLLAGSEKNFVINRLGDILVNQFSGQTAESMKRAYADFCSRHTKAVKLYKELFTRDKRFQQFVRKMTRSSVLRRHGIQECILLVTQRITKYPVLLERILQNTKGNEEDQRDLGHSLVLVKELITAVDQEVHECEKRFRLQDIYNRMDMKATATMQSGRQFRREDLIRRKLVHDGFVLWKTATGRFKDIQVLLLTDVLIFLQEKDQRYSFPALDNKPAVISLQKLIVRDIANQEKGMFLISAAAQIPEMYEIHTASKEERSTWMKVIQRTVNVCPEMDDFSMEIETKEILRELADEIQKKDRGITDLLEERAGLFLQILQLKASEDLTPDLSTRKLFRLESSDCPKGEKLLNDAVKEVQSLSELMVNVGGPSGQPASSSSVDQTPGNVDPGGTNSSISTNGEQPNVNGTTELCRTDSLNSLGRDRNGNQLQVKSHNEEAMLRLSRLSFLLHGLQAIVIRQDSLIEAQRQQLGEQKGKQAPKESPLVEQERLRSLEKQREELVGLGRQHSLLQEEFQRCRKACEEKGQELRALEARLLDSERSKAELEREREEWRRSSGGPEPETPVATEQLRRKPRSHARQFSLPSAQFTCLGMTPRQSSLQRRRSADESCLRGALTSEGPFDPPSASTDQSEGSGLPWPTGREAPLRTDCEAGAERGPAPDASLCLREESSGEESRSPSPSSSESSEEVTDMEQPQNIPEGSGSGQPAPAGGDPAPQPEDDEDDLYY